MARMVRYVDGMSELPSLPTVSAPAMLWALHRIAYSGDEQQYTSGRLEELKQPRAIGTLLRFLRLVGGDGRLAPAVQATRGNPQRFRDLLRQQFKAICVERDWWNPQLEAEFGVAMLKEEPLQPAPGSPFRPCNGKKRLPGGTCWPASASCISFSCKG